MEAVLAAFFSSARVLVFPLMVTYFGLEPALDVHPQLPGGQVAEVPDRGLHVVAGAQVLPDGLGLGGRLDDHERTPRPAGRRPGLGWPRLAAGARPSAGAFARGPVGPACRGSGQASSLLVSRVSPCLECNLRSHRVVNFGNSKKGVAAGGRKADETCKLIVAATALAQDQHARARLTTRRASGPAPPPRPTPPPAAASAATSKSASL